MIDLKVKLLCSAMLTTFLCGSEWNYSDKGPSQWGHLDTSWEICLLGQEQSPIDIRSIEVLQEINDLKFHYQADSNNVVNNGHTLELNFNSISYIDFDDVKYNLLQIHFHTPSENQVNGHQYPLEGHLVHKNQDGKLLVIGVFLEEGKENPFIKEILKYSNAPIIKEIPLKNISATTLLPRIQHFYSFKGSLTTPPCSENVQWVVFDTPMSASKEQIQKLEELFHHNNARSVQPTNGRKITYTK